MNDIELAQTLRTASETYKQENIALSMILLMAAERIERLTHERGIKFTNAGDYMNQYKKPPAPMWVNAFIIGLCILTGLFIIWWNI
jgi:hypothetical protein